MDERGENQTTLAEKVGMKRQTIGYYTKGQSQPRAEGLSAIARALHVSTEYLVGASDVIDSECNERDTGIEHNQKTKRTIEYVCEKCGKAFRFKDVPNYCPNCGCNRLEANKAARAYAKDLICSMSDMIPELERLQREYTKHLAEFARLKKIVKSYADRGLISFNDIPKMKKVSVRDIQKGEPEND